MLSLRQLVYFNAAVTAGSISGAAERLRLTPTAIGQQFRTMEDHLGVRLLERHSRGISPTPAGRLLKQKSREILALLEETEQQIRRMGPEGGPVMLHFGMTHSAMRAIGVDALCLAPRWLGRVELRLVEDTAARLNAMRAEGVLDLVLGAGLDPASGDELHEILEDQLVLVAAPGRHAPGRRLTLAEVLEAAPILYRGDEDCHAALQRAAAQAGGRIGGDLPGPQRFEAPDLVRQMVARGLACTVCSYGAVRDEAERGMLAVHEIIDPPLLRRKCVAFAGDDRLPVPRDRLMGYLSELTEAFVRCLGPHARRLAGPVAGEGLALVGE